jgi:hypothetical protein
MTLTEKLDAVMRELSLLPNTRSCYHGWVKAFYRQFQQPRRGPFPASTPRLAAGTAPLVCRLIP